MSAPTAQLSERAAFSLVRSFRRRHGCAPHALELPHLNLLRRRCRRQIVVQPPRVRLRDVPLLEPAHANGLPASERPADLDLVADFEPPVRLRRLTIDLDLPGLARVLRLRARLEQARDVEPDV